MNLPASDNAELKSTVSIKGNYAGSHSRSLSSSTYDSYTIVRCNDLVASIKNLGASLSITEFHVTLKWSRKRWLPRSFWSELPCDSHPEEHITLNPLEEHTITLINDWDSLISYIFPGQLHFKAVTDPEGKLLGQYSATQRIEFTLNVTWTYKTGVPNALPQELVQEYYVGSIFQDQDIGISWVTIDHSLPKGPFGPM